jgi:hypothetical protein
VPELGALAVWPVPGSVAGAPAEASSAPPVPVPELPPPVFVPPPAGEPLVVPIWQAEPCVHEAPSTQGEVVPLEAGHVLHWNVPSAPQLQQMAADEPLPGSLELSAAVVGPEPGSVVIGPALTEASADAPPIVPPEVPVLLPPDGLLPVPTPDPAFMVPP